MNFESFFSIVDDPNVFQFKQLNFSKYFYDKYLLKKNFQNKQNYSPNKITFKSLLLSPFFLLSGIFNLAILAFNKKNKGKYFFVGSGARSVKQNNEEFDIYNFNIINYLGKENVINIQNPRTGNKYKYQADLYILDFFPILGILFLGIKLFYFKEIKQFAENLNLKYPNLGFSKSEISNAVSITYSQYLFNLFILRLLKPKSIIMICHYAYHGLICASKKEKIKTIELMHGLILNGHKHYCINDFKESFRSAFDFMLPDFIYVYGQYWKDILISSKEFAKSKIEIIGYYLRQPHDSKLITKKSTEKTRILITSQTTIQKEMIDYIHFLKKNLDPNRWEVIIKPHPKEDHTKYFKLLEENFISINMNDIYSLLQNSNIHISGYSTVLYEAVLFNVINYTLVIKGYEHYSEEISNSGVAKKLFPDKLPETKSQKRIYDKNYFFAEFDGKILN